MMRRHLFEKEEQKAKEKAEVRVGGKKDFDFGCRKEKLSKKCNLTSKGESDLNVFKISLKPEV